MDRSRPYALLAEGSLLALAVVAPLALGAVHFPVIVAAAVCACVGTVALGLYRRSTSRVIQVPLFGYVLLFVTGYTALQAIPLPLALLRVVAPTNVALLAAALGDKALPTFSTISLDAGATWLAALKMGTCALTFILAHNLLGRPERLRRVVIGVVMAATLATLVGLIGSVVAPGKPWLLYSPLSHRATGLITVGLVNPNHGAAFLAVATLLALSLVVAVKQTQHRVLLAIMAAILGVGVLLTLSKAGIVAFGVGLTVLSILTFGRQSRRRLAAIGLVAAGAVVSAVWVAQNALTREFSRLLPAGGFSMGKLSLWPSGAHMTLSHPWVGVGRGAFASVFPRYLDAQHADLATYSHLENQYLHLPIEWGLPVAIALFAATAWCGVKWLRTTRRSALGLGCTAALAALGFHALFDFNLEILGIAALASVLAGALSASTSRHRDRESTRESTRSRSARRGPLAVVATAALLLVLGGWLVIVRPPTVHRELVRLSARIRGGASPKQVLAALDAAIRRHPTEHSLHRARARFLAAQKDPGALRALNRAMYLYPKSAQTHFEAAVILRRYGHVRQSLVEYRYALRGFAAQGKRATKTARRVLAQALPTCRGLKDVQLLLPPGSASYHALAGERLRRAGRLDLASALSSSARKKWPSDDQVAYESVRLHLATKQYAAAQAIADALCKRAPQPRCFLLLARATDAHRPGTAATVLRRAISRYPRVLDLRLALGHALLSSGKPEAAADLIKKILAQPTLRTERDQIRLRTLLAMAYRKQGRVNRANYEDRRIRHLRQGLGTSRFRAIDVRASQP